MFTKLDGVALGLALGSVSGTALLLATLAVALGAARPDRLPAAPGSVLPRISRQPGRQFPRAHLRAAAGFAFGWAFAFLRNAALALYLTIAFGRAEKKFLRRLFDYM